jgi:ATP synthase assembly factor FMC1
LVDIIVLEIFENILVEFIRPNEFLLTLIGYQIITIFAIPNLQTTYILYIVHTYSRRPTFSIAITTTSNKANQITMAQPIQQSRIRSLYRMLLRELPLRPHPGYVHPLSQRITASPASLLTSRSPIHKRIRAHVSPSGSETTAESLARELRVEQMEQRLKEAEQFAQYLKAQRMYTTLLERYNPGMGMDETERIRLTARRVGMNLPVEFETEGTGGGKDR